MPYLEPSSTKNILCVIYYFFIKVHIDSPKIMHCHARLRFTEVVARFAYLLKRPPKPEILYVKLILDKIYSLSTILVFFLGLTKLKGEFSSSLVIPLSNIQSQRHSSVRYVTSIQNCLLFW